MKSPWKSIGNGSHKAVASRIFRLALPYVFRADVKKGRDVPGPIQDFSKVPPGVVNPRGVYLPKSTQNHAVLTVPASLRPQPID